TLEYMRKSNRSEEQIALVETYCKTNMLWREHEDKITFTDVLVLDLDTIVPTVAGPKRPQDKILLKDFKEKFIKLLDNSFDRRYIAQEDRDMEKSITRFEGEGGDIPSSSSSSVVSKVPIDIEAKEKNGLKTVWITNGQEKFMLSDGSVAIAAITSCTNTS